MTFPFPILTPKAASAPTGPGGPSYFNTGGRGNRTGSITVTTTFSLSSGSISNLVNGNFTADSSNSCQVSGSPTSGNFKFDFGSAKIVDGFRWYQSTLATIGTFVFEASNDDVSYTPIGSSVSLGTSGSVTVFTATNTTAYRYYRLRLTSGFVGSTPLEEIEFRITVPGDPARDTYEYGDRTSLITVTTTASLSSGTINNLVDGAYIAGSSDSFFWGSGQSTKEIKFDLGSGVTKVMTGLHWLQDTTSGHGTWVFEGSNDDSTYTGLGSSFTLGGAQCCEVTWSNSTAYRYYKLRQTAGTTSSSPWDMEIEFRIA